MGYKHVELDPGPVLHELACPNFLIKFIPHVDGGPRICELVRYRWQDVRLKGAWSGTAALKLFAHALGNVAKLPVLNVLSGTHFVADVTLGIGEVVHDYLAQGHGRRGAQRPSSAGQPGQCNEYREYRVISRGARTAGHFLLQGRGGYDSNRPLPLPTVHWDGLSTAR